MIRKGAGAGNWDDRIAFICGVEGSFLASIAGLKRRVWVIEMLRFAGMTCIQIRNFKRQELDPSFAGQQEDHSGPVSLGES